MVKRGARSEKRREIRGCSDQVRGDPRAAPLARARDCAIDCPSHPSGPAAPRPIAGAPPRLRVRVTVPSIAPLTLRARLLRARSQFSLAHRHPLLPPVCFVF